MHKTFTKKFITLSTVACLLLINFASLQSATAADGWTYTTIDSDGTTGANTKIAIGLDGYPRIIFTDSTDDQFNFVQCLNATCTSKNITTLVSDSGAGGYSDIAIGTDGFARISHIDWDDKDLEYIQCTNADCSTKVATTIDSSGTTGYYSSIAIGNDGYARISYRDWTADDINFVQCTNDSCSTKVITAADSSSTSPRSNAVDIGSDGYARIVYVDSEYDKMVFIQCTNDSCSTNNKENIAFTNVPLAQGSEELEMVLDSDDYARIAYLDEADDDLRYMQCTNATCSTNNITVLDSTGDVGRNPFIGLDSNDKAHITYRDQTNRDGKYVSCSNDDCSTNSITILASTGDVGSDCSLDIDNSDNIFISFYDGSGYDLELAAFINTVPTAGHTSDNVLGAVTQDTDGTGNVNIPFRVKDAETNSATTLDWQYSDDGGTTWNDLVAGDMTGEDGSKSSAIDWSGTEHTIVWNSKNQIDDTDQEDIQFAFRVNDGSTDSATRATSTSFAVDNLDPSATLSPLDDATSVTISDNLVITFSEAVDAESGNITLFDSSDTEIEAFDVTADITGTGTTVITINPASSLSYETEYYVQIDATAFDDDTSNSYAGITDTTTWSFTTEDTPTCPAISNAATYNAYPTCGVATCSSGYRLSNSACSKADGGSYTPPPSAGAGQIDKSIPMHESKAIGEIKSSGTNILMYIESNAGFKAKVSQTLTTQNHNLRVSGLNMVTKKIKVQVSSEPQTVEIGVGQQKDVDLDSDGVSDIRLSYNELLVNRIDLTVEQLQFDQLKSDIEVPSLYVEGSLVKEIGSSAVYLIENDKKCPFFNEDAFLGKDCKWSDIKQVDNLSSIPTGDMIYALEVKIIDGSNNHSFRYNLSYGTVTSDVKKLQEYLNSNGYVLAKSGPGSPGSETELFGELTLEALVRFQKDNNITPAVGFFGPITRGVVNK
jgi:hypothetical protein